MTGVAALGSTSPRGHRFAYAITRCGNNSAIWIVFSAAPFSN